MSNKTPWHPRSPLLPHPIVELPDRTPDPISIYAERYKGDFPGYSKIERYRDEVLSEFKDGSSVLFFGAGHSENSNFVLRTCPNINNLTVIDYVKESGLSLDENIEFINEDFRTTDKLDTYDYVFSEHTIEHFSREDLIDTVVPKCFQIAREAVIFIVPYKENWSDEKSHRCLFDEHDELSSMCSKWKRIYDGKELVLWFYRRGKEL